MDTEKDVVSMINDFYLISIKNLINEMVPSVKEGIDEGIEKGVREGILDSLTECLDLGFLNIKRTDPKKLEEILRDGASGSIKEQVKQKSQKKICPILEKEVEDICNELLKKIEENRITVSNDLVDITKEINGENIVKTNIEEFEQEVAQHIPKNNFIYNIFLEPLKQSLYQCLYKNFNSCTERIEKSLKI